MIKYVREREKSEDKVRDANVEAFRCGLMFIIVLYHSFVDGVFKDSVAWWTIIYSSLLMWHVDGFIAISGWFGVRWSITKFLRLFASIWFYSILSFAYICIAGDDVIALKHFRISAGWFGGTYMMLLMIAPMINMLIDTLCKMPFGDVFKVWGLFALAITLTWAPRNLFTGVNASGADDYSIAIFVFVYLTVRLIRLRNLHIRQKHIVFGSLVFLMGIGTMGLIMCGVRLLNHDEINGACFRLFCTYNAPHVWIMAILMMILFGRFIKIPKKFGRPLRFIGPSMFGIYLCHNTTSFGALFYRVPENWLLHNTALHPCIIIFLCAIVTFGICLLIDLVRRGLFRACIFTFKSFRRRLMNYRIS